MEFFSLLKTSTNLFPEKNGKYVTVSVFCFDMHPFFKIHEHKLPQKCPFLQQPQHIMLAKIFRNLSKWIKLESIQTEAWGL